LALLQHLSAIYSGNIIISPFSLSAALTMTANGANTTTKQTIFQAAGLSGAPVTALNAAYSSLIQMYSSTSPTCMYNVSNSLWLSMQHNIDPTFAQQIAPRYFADVRNIDFRSPEAATALNLWVAQRTNGKITDAVRTLDPNSAMVLLNATYFRAAWQSKFSDQMTQPGVFNQSGTAVNVQMMSQTSRFGFCPAEQFDAVSLPYQGPVRMSIVVPNTADLPLDALAAGISVEIWQQIRDYLGSQLSYGRITMPKFNLKSYLSLREGLTRAGLGELFDPNRADLTGLTAGKPGFISQIDHAACLSADESGTESPPSPTPPPVSQAVMEFDMTVDKPFLLVIEDAQTGAFLYLGLIRNIVETAPQRTASDTGALSMPQPAAAAAAAPAAPASEPASPRLVEFDHSEATSEFPAFADETPAAAPANPATMPTEAHSKPQMTNNPAAAYAQQPLPAEQMRQAGDWLDQVAEDQMETAASWPSLQSLGAAPGGAQPAASAAQPAPAAPAQAPPPPPPAPDAPPEPEPLPAVSPDSSPPQADSSLDDANWAPQGGWGDSEQSSWLDQNKTEGASEWATKPSAGDWSSSAIPPAPPPAATEAPSAAAPNPLSDLNSDWAAPSTPSKDDWAAPSTPNKDDWAAPSNSNPLSDLGSDWAAPSSGNADSGNAGSAAGEPGAGNWLSDNTPKSDWASPGEDWAAPSKVQANPDWATPQQSAMDQSSASGNWKAIPNPPLMDRTPGPAAASASSSAITGDNPSQSAFAPQNPAPAAGEAYDLAALNAIATPKPTGGFNLSELDSIRAPGSTAEEPKPSIADLNSIPTPKPAPVPKGTTGEWSKTAAHSAEGEQLVQGFATRGDPDAAKEKRDSLRSLRGGGGSSANMRGVKASSNSPGGEGFMAAIMNFFGRMFGRRD
jgi:serpin B